MILGSCRLVIIGCPVQQFAPFPLVVQEFHRLCLQLRYQQGCDGDESGVLAISKSRVSRVTWWAVVLFPPTA